MIVCGIEFYQMAWYFIFYSFAGWILEVVYHAVTMGKVVNRGFLNGPVCPVYGFGVLAVVVMISLAGETEKLTVEVIPFWQLFIGGIVLSSIIELIAGWMLNRIFHARWWDYSNKPFNLNGYICLEFSLIWGLAIVFVVREIHPAVRNIPGSFIPKPYGWAILFALYALCFTDLVITVLTVLRLNKKLEELGRIQEKLRLISDGMSRLIGENTLKTMDGIERRKIRMESVGEEVRSTITDVRGTLRTGVIDAKKRIHVKKKSTLENIGEYPKEIHRRQEELYYALQKEKFFGTGRILRAFPDMKHGQFNEALSWIQKKLKQDS